MWLIVGLGNPGPRYLLTRHNVGFMALDSLVNGYGSLPSKTEFNAITSKFKLDGEEILVAKPQTFMNLSGESVAGLLQFYKVNVDQMLVIHDDIDQPFGALRFHKNRGAGGHNGIKSITETLGSQDYARLKLGVGRPTIPEMDVAAYVLQNFSADEMKALPSFLDVAADAVESFVFEGLEKATTKFNKNNSKSSELT